MRPRYDVPDSEVTGFEAAINGGTPVWEIPDPEFEKGVGKGQVWFRGPYSAAFGRGEDFGFVLRPSDSVEVQAMRRAGAFYLHHFNKWKVGDEFRFNLPGGLGYVVTLTAIDPITPETRSGRTRGDWKYGWQLRWDPASVRQVSRR